MVDQAEKSLLVVVLSLHAWGVVNVPAAERVNELLYQR